MQLTKGHGTEKLQPMFGEFGAVTFTLWRQRLAALLHVLQERKRRTRFFYAKLFLFFVGLNVACYWIAMLTAFPEVTFGPRQVHYFWVQIPVGLLGALFDSLSLFVTVYMVRRALASATNGSYVAHLSLDIGIAVLATFWVLFVFSASGWMISLMGSQPESLVARNSAYQDRLFQALQDPTGREELRNIYFGVLMGLSAALPTLTHVYCSLRAAASSIRGAAPIQA
tara:strand:+ start:4648 stop:5325 length:678 start_codon:yes stop_codon:yes gene_type:complete